MERFSQLMNCVPQLLLRSPLHGLMSNRYLLITFTGRKSGKRYTTPVAYLATSGGGERGSAVGGSQQSVEKSPIRRA